MLALLAQQVTETVPVLDEVIVLPPTWVLILAAVSPGIVSLAARYRGSDHTWHKVIAGVLVLVLAVVGMLTDDKPNDTLGSIIANLVTVAVTQFTFFQLVASPLKLNQKLLPDVGIGAPAPAATIDPAKVSEGPPPGGGSASH